MTAAIYEYRGLIAEYWDLLRGDTSGWSSRPYFLDVIRRSGEPALDVACGTGRLLLDYLQEGIDIDGVDISAEMLSICRQKADDMGFAPRLYQQAMEELDLTRRYQTIIVPSSSFLQITNVAASRQALNRFWRHLRPGGVLAMSMRVLEPDPTEAEFHVEAEVIRPSDGALIRRWWRCWYDPPKRLQHTEDRYEIIKDGEIITSELYRQSPALTWFSPADSLQLLRDAGFDDVRGYHDFTDEPISEDDTSFTVHGTRPLEGTGG